MQPSMKVFMKNELLLAVLLGLLVLLFVHTGSESDENRASSSYYHDQPVSEANKSIKYIKVFLGTVVVVYILLYLLNSVSRASDKKASAVMVGGGAMDSAASKLLNDSIETLMKNIDLSDPTF